MKKIFRVQTGLTGDTNRTTYDVQAHYKQVFDLSDSRDRNQYNFLLKSSSNEIVAEEDLGGLIAVYVVQSSIKLR